MKNSQSPRPSRAWGGARRGAGRPPVEYETKQLSIALYSDEEAAQFTALAPLERREALLRYVSRSAGTPSGAACTVEVLVDALAEFDPQAIVLIETGRDDLAAIADVATQSNGGTAHPLLIPSDPLDPDDGLGPKNAKERAVAALLQTLTKNELERVLWPLERHSTG